MFDSIVISGYVLPQPENPQGYLCSKDFQTKDFNCYMDYYEIREDGSLWIRKSDTEWVEGDAKSKSVMDRIGYLKTIKSWWEKYPITQTINFYDYQESDVSEFDYSIEYEAVIVEGFVKEVKIFKFEAIENDDRKKRDIEFDRKWKERREFQATTKYKLIYGPYNKVITTIFRYMSKIAGYIQNHIYKWESKFLV